MSTSKFVVQTHDQTGTLYHSIKAQLALPQLKRIRIAAAYARWDGIGLFSTELERVVAAGATFESIYGAGNGVTTPDSLLYGIYLKELYPDRVRPFLVEDKFANSIFHPKLYIFGFSNHSIAIVGSANLTGGGLVRNSEVVVELTVAAGGAHEKALNNVWTKLINLAQPITPSRVRAIMKGADAGSETNQREGLQEVAGKPYLGKGPKVAPKPLFEKVLNLKSASKKSKILSKLDSLSQKPSRLYLQIFENETGGNAGSLGYQVQLPVATLATYFGVGETQTKQAEFRFKGETVKTSLTHFDNHTHRVRLKPILGIPRPAILIFDRISDDIYRVRPERPDRYQKTLSNKCTQQSRAGSRFWGLE